MKKFLLLLLLLPFTFYGQLSLTNDSPRDLQLVARDPGDSNRGIIPISGTYDKSGAAADYTSIRVKVYRGGSSSTYDTGTETIAYSGTVGTFDFGTDIKIESEAIDYTVIVYGVIGSDETLLKSAVRVVAGDVYVIQGQSNAVAQIQEDSGSSSGAESPYIRVYGSAQPLYSRLLNQDSWYEGRGDVTRGTPGNTGQWGIKLARMLLDKYGYPVAIFNGARGASSIAYFQKDYQEWTSSSSQDEFLEYGEMNNNYGRLHYRLEKTGLRDNVRAVLWSQGERTSSVYATDTYKSYFKSLIAAWNSDYDKPDKSIAARFYIFQTRYCQGCDFPDGPSPSTTYFDEIMETKEAQRQLAYEESDIQIMPTNALNASYYDGDGWHFVYDGGYEDFAKRIFPLVDRDLYSGGSNNDFNAPMIQYTVLTNGTELTIETDANSLNMDAGMTTEDFVLEDAGGTTIIDIGVNGSDIILTLSKDPGSSATISYTAQRVDNGYVPKGDPNYTPVTPSEYIKNSQGIELVCFNKFPINERVDLPVDPTWNGVSWSPAAPTASTDAIIEGDYDANDGSFIANNLTINSGADLDFDNGTKNSVVLHGDLTINGTFTIGDEESLVMYDQSANITGVITKKESSTDRSSVDDFTYWSSSVESSASSEIRDVFPGVDPTRIFYYDQNESTATEPDTPGFWDVWVKAPQTMRMTAGMGFAAEGNGSGIHSIAFTGKPQNGDVTISTVHQNPGNDYNLIGNPYPSAIDIHDFFNSNANVDVAYLWTHNTPPSGENGDFVSADYATINLSTGTAACGGCPKPQPNIGSGQGFMIIDNGGSGTGDVKFTNDMRMEEANDQFFKASKSKKKDKVVPIDGKIWLNLKTDQGGFSQIAIVFMEGLSNKVDQGYDSKVFSGSENPITFYSLIEKEKYVIQGLGTFTKNRKVKLGFDTNVGKRKFTISIDDTEGALSNTDVFLEDKYLKLTHNLSKSEYEFKQEEIGDFTKRFVLKFTSDKDDKEEKEEEAKYSFKVLNGRSEMTVKANEKMKNLKVYSIYGKRLISKKPNSKKYTLNTRRIKRGTVLIIEATFNKGVVIRKKTIKR